MPYHLRKAPRKNLFWVVNADSGKKYSSDPLPRERAEAQRRAIYASENGYVLRNRSRSRSKRSSPRRSTSLRRRSKRRLSGGISSCVYFTGYTNGLLKTYFSPLEFVQMCKRVYLKNLSNEFPDINDWDAETWANELGGTFYDTCPV
jgi:hypothetical protein